MNRKQGPGKTLGTDSWVLTGFSGTNLSHVPITLCAPAKLSHTAHTGSSARDERILTQVTHMPCRSQTGKSKVSEPTLTPPASPGAPGLASHSKETQCEGTETCQGGLCLPPPHSLPKSPSL